MNYLVVGVIVLWCVSAYRKRYSTKPTDVLPGSRSEALKEILGPERATEFPYRDVQARADAGEPHAVEMLATAREEANGGV